MANGRQARQEATLTARAFGGIHSTLGKLGVATGIGVVTAGVVGLAKSAVSLEAKFGQTMSTLQAATGASGRAMDQLNAKAIKLGADTSFSASDAADAMLELAKAGISTRDILGGGVAGTLTLAAAGGTELATAATIASNAMNAF
ncbi:MAG TPA: phage tail tape measure protein, partial [Phytomonospora sp.]